MTGTGGLDPELERGRREGSSAAPLELLDLCSGAAPANGVGLAGACWSRTAALSEGVAELGREPEGSYEGGGSTFGSWRMSRGTTMVLISLLAARRAAVEGKRLEEGGG
jgi:hypothetical protein